jgi:carboxylesterase type B
MKVKVKELNLALRTIKDVIMGARDLDLETKEALINNEKLLVKALEDIQETKEFQEVYEAMGNRDLFPDTSRDSFNAKRKEVMSKIVTDNKREFQIYNKSNAQALDPKYNALFPTNVIVPPKIKDIWNKELEKVYKLYPEVKKQDDNIKKLDDAFGESEIDVDIKLIDDSFSFTANEYNVLKFMFNYQ